MKKKNSKKLKTKESTQPKKKSLNTYGTLLKLAHRGDPFISEKNAAVGVHQVIDGL
jgi:hypothetical protein